MSLSAERLPIAADVPLASRTTLGVGGSARWLATALDEAGVIEALEWGRHRHVPVLVLGGGSNVVVSDRGFDGLVIDIALRGIRCEERGGGVRLTVGSGEIWDDVVDYAVSRGLSGIECLSGIPGRVGATPIQNVGAYGQEVAETVVAVVAIARESGERETFSGEQCQFSYRSSIFKREQKDAWVITSVTFSLERDRPPAIRYAELERRLAGRLTPSLRDVRQAVLALRRSKGMVLDPADPDSRSVGSFFMNPIVDDGSLSDLIARASNRGIAREAIPAFPVTGGGTKLSAGWLIEHAGFEKGYRRGNVGLSAKHALAIVNCGGATAEAIRALAEEIQSAVREAFGVELEPEAGFVGR
jgi:UDP-N-acetylmuramate dehydrogenase